MTPEEYWVESDLPAECLAWVKQVDVLMKRDWLINTSDAGLSEEDVLRYWSHGETPDEFVAWFAEKYDLVRLDNPWCPPVPPSSST